MGFVVTMPIESDSYYYQCCNYLTPKQMSMVVGKEGAEMMLTHARSRSLHHYKTQITNIPMTQIMLEEQDTDITSAIGQVCS